MFDVGDFVVSDPCVSGAGLRGRVVGVSALWVFVDCGGVLRCGCIASFQLATVCQRAAILYDFGELPDLCVDAAEYLCDCDYCVSVLGGAYGAGGWSVDGGAGLLGDRLDVGDR